jgi:hypothetical protein
MTRTVTDSQFGLASHVLTQVFASVTLLVNDPEDSIETLRLRFLLQTGYPLDSE